MDIYSNPNFTMSISTSLIWLLTSLNWFDPIDDPYKNIKSTDVVDASKLDDPLRNGIDAIGQGVGGIKNDEITGFTDAKDTLLSGIQNGINRFLGFLALIALIYLIIQGIKLLLNPKDDEVKKIQGHIKAAARAIGGIGLSRLFVSFVFRAIGQFIGA